MCGERQKQKDEQALTRLLRKENVMKSPERCSYSRCHWLDLMDEYRRAAVDEAAKSAGKEAPCKMNDNMKTLERNI